MKATFYLLMIASSISVIATALAAEKQTVGWLEKARIFPGGYQLSAKIDTGADNSSLNVHNLTPFQRDGQEWARFTVIDDNGKQHKLEKKTVRLARIKRHSAPRQERPVVLLGICVGAVYREVRVNLVDRSKFKYPLAGGTEFYVGRANSRPVQNLFYRARLSGSAR